VKITGWLAAVGAVIGAVVGLVLHALVWRPSGPVGWWSFSSSRRYTDYLLTGDGPRQSLTLHIDTSGGLHSSWWPLLSVTVVVGLITGALLGALLVAYRASQRRTASPTA
jgi:hypothetical protein